VNVKNRRYAAVLSRLNKQTPPALQPSTFSGYVPKCKHENAAERKNAVVTTSASGSVATEQRKVKVSFRLQAEGYDDTASSSRKTSSLSPKRPVIVSSCDTATTTTATMVSVTSSEMISSAASLPNTDSSSIPVSDATTVPFVLVPADADDLSFLCSELFVDHNTGFCDQLLESLEQSRAPNVPPDVSPFNLKPDCGDAVGDFTFDDLLEFDELLTCN